MWCFIRIDVWYLYVSGRYKAILECERIVVKSFNSTYEVSTYRAAKLSDDFYTLKAELEQRRESALSKARSELSRDPSLLNGRVYLRK